MSWLTTARRMVRTGGVSVRSIYLVLGIIVVGIGAILFIWLDDPAPETQGSNRNSLKEPRYSSREAAALEQRVFSSESLSETDRQSFRDAILKSYLSDPDETMNLVSELDKQEYRRIAVEVLVAYLSEDGYDPHLVIDKWSKTSNEASDLQAQAVIPLTREDPFVALDFILDPRFSGDRVSAIESLTRNWDVVGAEGLKALDAMAKSIEDESLRNALFENVRVGASSSEIRVFMKSLEAGELPVRKFWKAIYRDELKHQKPAEVVRDMILEDVTAEVYEVALTEIFEEYGDAPDLPAAIGLIWKSDGIPWKDAGNILPGLLYSHSSPQTALKVIDELSASDEAQLAVARNYFDLYVNSNVNSAANWVLEVTNRPLREDLVQMLVKHLEEIGEQEAADEWKDYSNSTN